ncbi:MAG: hypothetical protein AAF581_09680 [Planctomycetota bacterium]
MAVDRQWMLDQLRNSLRLLAAPGSSALASLPEDRLRPEELVQAFDDAREVLLSDHGPGLPEKQRQCLLDLDDAIVAMSSSDPERWTGAAVRRDPIWEDVRLRAHQTLEAFGWSA